MFRRVNGVLIREFDETKELPSIFDKRFEFKFYDNLYLHKRISVDFMNINVKGYGRNWMFSVKETDYEDNKYVYSLLVKVIHNKVQDYLERKYGYEPNGWILMKSGKKFYMYLNNSIQSN